MAPNIEQAATKHGDSLRQFFRTSALFLAVLVTLERNQHKTRLLSI